MRFPWSKTEQVVTDSEPSGDAIVVSGLRKTLR